MQIDEEINLEDNDFARRLYSNKTICKIRVDDYCEIVRPIPMFDQKLQFLKDYQPPNSIVQQDSKNINTV